jgi:hypothetical protein
MRNRKLMIGLVVVAVLGIAWYLFRPELLFINTTVNEGLPGVGVRQKANEQPSVLAKGSFHGVAHESKGNATVHQLADGKRVLRFTEFETSNGPALHVYLVAAEGATDNDTVTKAGFLDLGELKGNKGDQNYNLPAGVDLDKYRAVTIWCQRFSVNFATAPLLREPK